MVCDKSNKEVIHQNLSSCVSYFVELADFKTRRIAHFRKNMVDLAELELKHARVSTYLINKWQNKGSDDETGIYYSFIS